MITEEDNKYFEYLQQDHKDATMQQNSTKEYENQTEVVFVQDATGRKSDHDNSNVTCYLWEKKDHYAKDVQKSDYMYIMVTNVVDENH